VPTETLPGEFEDYWGPAPSPKFIVSRWNFKTIKNLLRLLKASRSAQPTPSAAVN